VALTADHVLVIGKGRILADAPVSEFVDGAARKVVRVRSPQATAFAELLLGTDAEVDAVEPGLLEVRGPDAAAVGELAAMSRIVLHELTPVASTLEEAYMSLTADSVEYQSEDIAAHAGTRSDLEGSKA
jgi:ABC-2 type transport system ATP-binding protein